MYPGIFYTHLLLLLQKWREKCGSKQTSQVTFENSFSAVVRFFACSFVRLVCSFAGVPVRSFFYLFFSCSFVRLFVCSFVRLFVCAFVRLFVLSAMKLVFAFITEVSTTQPESSSEEEEERPSSLGIPSESSDSDDEQGILEFSFLSLFFCLLLSR